MLRVFFRRTGCWLIQASSLRGRQEVEWLEAMGPGSRVLTTSVCKPQTLVARRPKQVPVATGDKANKSPMFFLIAALGSSEP
jgi:hypothetical protein